MCREHWFMVPKALQDRVYQAWRNWRGAKGTGAEYVEARDAAIATANQTAAQGSLL